MGCSDNFFRQRAATNACDFDLSFYSSVSYLVFNRGTPGN